MMKNYICFFCLLLSIVSCRKVTEMKHSNRFLQIDGPNIINPDGEVFLICGINLANWLNPEGDILNLFDPEMASYRNINEAFCEMVGPDFTKEFWRKYKENYITEEDIVHIKQMGMNSIRIPFHYKLFTNEDYMGLDSNQDGFDQLDRVIEWCRKHGLYVVLDMHTAPGGQTGDFTDDGYNYPWLMESESSKNQFCRIWKDVATHYANDTIILGYDLLNEPISSYFAENYPHLNDSLEPLYKRCIDSIRKVDNNHIVILGGTQGDSNFKIFKNSNIDKMMYTSHRYHCDTLQSNIQDLVDFRDSVNVPMYIGETGENTNDWIRAWTKLMNKNNIGWHYWPYKKINSGSCMLVIKKPNNWNVIENFVQCKSSMEGIHRCRPDGILVENSLKELLENMKFENCEINEDYTSAMGLRN